MRAGWLVLCLVIAACAEDREAPPEPTTTRVIVGVRASALDRPQIVASQVGLQARMLAYAAEPVHAFQTVPYVVMRRVKPLSTRNSTRKTGIWITIGRQPPMGLMLFSL